MRQPNEGARTPQDGSLARPGAFGRKGIRRRIAIDGLGETMMGHGVRGWLAVALGLTVVLGAQSAAAQCSSTAAIMCGETKNGALSAVGEIDCFTFSATAGETVSITTEKTAGLFQACWTLQGPNGSLGGACGQAERTLPDTGAYTIEVFDQ